MTVSKAVQIILLENSDADLEDSPRASHLSSSAPGARKRTMHKMAPLERGEFIKVQINLQLQKFVIKVASPPLV
ncbi:hypothetical protein PoB_003401800 [Plakobranchus ocellatus]|uniref:Uncharacterized protein n=1 Tax=Plakobranchus ocellatus TaxID=259542 RepID=A0AAV4ALS2_9GAST|nr:hypothetical protein PoB_003401800 [Plakobranchus ocellatus]